MSVTQYVGARYVPLFSEPLAWNSKTTYEPLTIVYHEGNSYTSRQYVPEGIDIANDKYWALTGNYNAQIEQYRKEVQAFDGRITAAQNAADSKAPINHATDSTEYGVGNVVNYGHVKLADIDTPMVSGANDGIAATPKMVKSFSNKINVGAYYAYDNTQVSYNNKLLNIVASNDCVNWSLIKQIDTFTEFGISGDSCNITPYKEGYILNISDFIIQLDNDFNIVKSAKLNFDFSIYKQYWGISIFVDDTDDVYALVSRTTSTDDKSLQTFIGTSYAGFNIAIAPVDMQNISVGTATNINGVNVNSIDPHMVKHGGTYYLAVKDEAESNVCLYTSSSITGRFEKKWTNKGLHGIEAPKLVVSDNLIKVYVSAYQPSVVDKRKVTTLSINGEQYTVINDEKKSTQRFCGYYIVGKNFQTITALNLCRFEYGIPRHFSVHTTENSLNFTSGTYDNIYSSGAAYIGNSTSTYEHINSVNLNSSNTTNMCSIIPCCGINNCFTREGGIQGDFVKKYAVLYQPGIINVNKVNAMYHVSGSDRRNSPLIYIGQIYNGVATLPNHSSIKKWEDRATYNHLASPAIIGGWLSSGAND